MYDNGAINIISRSPFGFCADVKKTRSAYLMITFFIMKSNIIS